MRNVEPADRSSESRVTRRIFLADFGKVSVGVALFGVAACSGDGAATPTTSTALATSPATTSSSATTVAPTDTSVATTSTETTVAPAAAGWQRVVLGGVSAYVVVRAGEGAVVDTGVTGSEKSIGDAIAALGLGWGDVSSVLVTHDHPDHAGSIGAVMELAAGATAYAGAADIGDIQAPRDLATAADGDVVFGLDVIATPGHTPGHLCFMDASLGLLFAGDALLGQDGAIAGPSSRFSTDIDEANASVAKLLAAGPDAIAFGHGDPVLSGATELLTKLSTDL